MKPHPIYLELQYIAKDTLGTWVAGPTPQAKQAFYSSGQPVMAPGDFGGGQRPKTCTAATLGQLSGICKPEASGGWLQCVLRAKWSQAGHCCKN